MYILRHDQAESQPRERGELRIEVCQVSAGRLFVRVPIRVE